jgi:multidrug efflux pump subunit AcrA (membrane-fusion protein)
VKLGVQLVIAILMLAGAGGAWWYFYVQAPAASGATNAAARANMAVPVETAKVAVGPIERRLGAVGSLRSNESVIVRPEIAGRIVAIPFAEGERVERGATLVMLDDTIYRAEVDQVQAAQVGTGMAKLKSARPAKMPTATPPARTIRNARRTATARPLLRGLLWSRSWVGGRDISSTPRKVPATGSSSGMGPYSGTSTSTRTAKRRPRSSPWACRRPSCRTRRRAR